MDIYLKKIGVNAHIAFKEKIDTKIKNKKVYKH